MKTRISLASLLAAGLVAAAANAEFAPGNFVAINGFAGGSPNPDIHDTTWGTWADQGAHQLGGQSNYWDSFYGTGLPVFVSSSVVSPWSVVFVIDFTQFVSTDYTLYSFSILGLKSDGSVLGASGPTGTAGFTTDGNSIHWEGSINDLLGAGNVLTFKVYQEPAPGAIALLGVAGLAGSRRRRA